MAGKERGAPDPLQLRQRALSRWDNEGGASRQGSREGAVGGSVEPTDIPPLTNAGAAGRTPRHKARIDG